MTPCQRVRSSLRAGDVRHVEMEPRKFRSAMRSPMQLARRVRRLTDANAAHSLDAIANKSKRVHSNSRRGAAKVFGGCLAGTLGTPGVVIDFPASEGRRYHSLGDPRLGDFRALSHPSRWVRSWVRQHAVMRSRLT